MNVAVTLESKSLLCLYCERPWPVAAEFRECPVCREATEERDKPSMDPEIAEREKAHGAFGWWLWEHELV